MSIRYEGAYADNVSASLQLPLSEIGDDTLSPGEYAITISYDEVFYLYGPPADLIAAATRILDLARQALNHSQKPLRFSDIDYIASDHTYRCPRCGEDFELGGSLADLTEMVNDHIRKHDEEGKVS